MEDLVVFLKDIEEEGQIVFKKGKKYEILDENKNSYYIQRVKRTNKVSQFDKNLEGILFNTL